MEAIALVLTLCLPHTQSCDEFVVETFSDGAECLQVAEQVRAEVESDNIQVWRCHHIDVD